MTWGLKAPEGVSVAWGARAIYRDMTIDLLPDRQSWSGEDRKPLMGWLNSKGIEGIRKVCDDAYLTTDSAETVTFREGGWVIEASPRASYGYLYMVAYAEGGDMKDVDLIAQADACELLSGSSATVEGMTAAFGGGDPDLMEAWGFIRCMQSLGHNATFPFHIGGRWEVKFQ